MFFRSHDPPCGLHNSLSTLHAICSVFVPLSGLFGVAPVSLHIGCAYSNGPVDTSASHVRLGNGGWLILSVYGLPVNVPVDRSLYQRRQAFLGVPTCSAIQEIAESNFPEGRSEPAERENEVVLPDISMKAIPEPNIFRDEVSTIPIQIQGGLHESLC